LVSFLARIARKREDGKMERMTMKPATIAQIIETIQEAITLAMKQWLNENKQEVLAALKQALAEGQQFNVAEKEKTIDPKPYLSPAQLAARWGFHVESVRRLVRRESWPVVRVGRRIRIPIAFVEKYESAAS
jgi:excisionase family DNA binding protein